MKLREAKVPEARAEATRNKEEDLMFETLEEEIVKCKCDFFTTVQLKKKVPMDLKPSLYPVLGTENHCVTSASNNSRHSCSTLGSSYPSLLSGCT